MKFIKVPNPVRLPLGPEGTYYSLEQLVGHVLDTDARFQKPATAARQAQRILAALDAKQNGVVELRDDDHAALVKALEDPEHGHAAWVSVNGAGEQIEVTVPTRFYLPLIDAVELATHADPREAR